MARSWLSKCSAPCGSAEEMERLPPCQFWLAVLQTAEPSGRTCTVACAEGASVSASSVAPPAVMVRRFTRFDLQSFVAPAAEPPRTARGLWLCVPASRRVCLFRLWFDAGIGPALGRSEPRLSVLDDQA